MSAHQVLAQLANADWHINDPGASGTITVLRSGTCEIISAGVETRTLATPTRSDLEIALVGKTIVGTVTISVPNGTYYTEANDADFTITAAGQFMLLRSFEIASGTFAWRKIASDGIGSSTVALASEISIADAGSYTTETNVEGAIQEIYDTLTYWNTIDVPLGSITLEDGTHLTKQAAEDAGYAQLANKNVVISLPAVAGTGKVFQLAFTTQLPSDFDPASELKIAVVVTKGSNTDTLLKLDAEVYFLDIVNGWSADADPTGFPIAITQALTSLEASVANPGAVTDNPIGVAVVLKNSAHNLNDTVYIHSVSVKYNRKHQ